ncbi:hypothetical protein M2158_004090 [Streptomyces sp. SAI-144]|uniref:hypothetical protein n=1 Tax=Streptomyces sp. SAI-144 TaxID=2940544 RepID=UPI002475442F|nr:hypothetical protein [Streptomyces sp. SAI-144]MDH6435613.1 hypothetical protein [Streptomyces sp. SAI-144]
MIVVYTPAGGEPEHYDASTLKVSEASIVQRTVDMKWQEILQGLGEDDLDAMRGIVWVIKKRTTPSLRFGEFDPGVTEMTSRMTNDEVATFIEPLFAQGVANPELTTEVVADMLRSRIVDAAVDPEYANDLIDRLAAEAEDGPKDQPQPEASEESGSSPSPTSSAPAPPTSGSSRTSSTSHRRSSTTSSSATSTT